MTTTQQNALLTEARVAIVRQMLAEYAERLGTDSVWLNMAQNQAENAIHAGRSAFYAYERVGKDWLATKVATDGE